MDPGAFRHFHTHVPQETVSADQNRFAVDLAAQAAFICPEILHIIVPSVATVQ